MENNTPFFIVLGLIIGAGIIAGLYFSSDQEVPNPIENASPSDQELNLGNVKSATDNTPEVKTDVSSKPKEDSLNNSNTQNMTTEDKTKVQKPEMVIDKNKKYTALVKTSEGDISIELNALETPVTVNNFVALSKMGFYNDVIFHRVISGFMIQAGDPLGNGMGGPAYKFDDEPFTGDYTKGTVAMANSGPNTNGSQFFIMHQDNPLPKNYVIFGKVTSGLENVDKIATTKVELSSSGEMSKPVNQIQIKRLSVDVTEE